MSFTPKTYADNFARGFPFFLFNKVHIEEKKIKIKGLEIFSIGVVDIDENQAYHLYAKQTNMPKFNAVAIITQINTIMYFIIILTKK